LEKRYDVLIADKGEKKVKFIARIWGLSYVVMLVFASIAYYQDIKEGANIANNVLASIMFIVLSLFIIVFILQLVKGNRNLRINNIILHSLLAGWFAYRGLDLKVIINWVEIPIAGAWIIVVLECIGLLILITSKEIQDFINMKHAIKVKAVLEKI